MGCEKGVGCGVKRGGRAEGSTAAGLHRTAAEMNCCDSTTIAKATWNGLSQVEQQAQQRPQARRLMTHPGVGPVTALATEVFLGDPRRFAKGKKVASYIGMIPCENTSGKHQRLGELSKEGNRCCAICGPKRPCMQCRKTRS